MPLAVRKRVQRLPDARGELAVWIGLRFLRRRGGDFRLRRLDRIRNAGEDGLSSPQPAKASASSTRGLCMGRGCAGSVDDVYFDDREWKVRYLVVDPASGFPGGRCSLAAVRRIRRKGRGGHPGEAHVRKVRNAPGIDADQPVSRKLEEAHAAAERRRGDRVRDAARPRAPQEGRGAQRRAGGLRTARARRTGARRSAIAGSSGSRYAGSALACLTAPTSLYTGLAGGSSRSRH